jgi:pantoate--beta-alanine ligase
VYPRRNFMKKISKRPSSRLLIVRKLPALRRAVAALRERWGKIALVPTMGALHAGHLSLVRIAQRRADRVIVSIFVNPTQFAPNEDLSTYPRTFAADIAALANLKVDLVWSPTVETMYPAGFATRITPEGAATAGLEDAVRPQFFSGVATVVAKLLIQCEPDIALFGEKDYQQLKVVTQLVADLGLKTRIVRAPIVRERDGLALSSRNRYLSLRERLAAPVLYRVLKECAGAIAAGTPLAAVLENGRNAIAQAGFRLDYLEARHADTLAPLTGSGREPIRLLVAARLGNTRLIDNMAV